MARVSHRSTHSARLVAHVTKRGTDCGMACAIKDNLAEGTMR